MATALINGREISFTDTQDGEVAIVLSHGLFMDQSMFDAQVQALRGSYRVITWDQRGHGQAAFINEPFSLWDSADDLSALLAYLHINQAVLLGMSQGGYVSLRAALRYPEKVQALILIATQAGVEDETQRLAYTHLLNAWFENSLTDEIAQSVSGLILGPDKALAAPWVEKWRTIENSTLGFNFHALAERDDLVPALSELHVPALVIWGTEDGAIGIDQAKQLSAGLAGSQFLAVPGAAHSVSITHSAVVNSSIKAFLSDALR
ncbi:alpha/beta hydrolase [Pseudomonas batumici]|uniref:alpha/beta fold hydrolase n=1 Tax=Pseudomonas batumici TaxID=226910 RepID=UPI0030D16362